MPAVYRSRIYITLFLFFLLGSAHFGHSQSVEVFAGDKRAGVDLLWFRSIKNDKGATTPWLYFSRNRAHVDYHNQPQWASLNAVSYNGKSGWGLVGVGLFANSGFVPKAGVQLVKRNKQVLFFGWSVIELLKKPGVDVFGLFRYQPVLRPKLRLFLQAETSNTLPTVQAKTFSFTQRLRLGLSVQQWQFGFMADATETGRQAFSTTQNTGVFLRTEF